MLRDEVYRCDPTTAHLYRFHWVTQDLRIAPSFTVPIGQALFEERLMPARVWKQSAIYNDFLAPHDVPWFLAFLLHNTPTKVVNFSINSTRSRGPFDERDARRIEPLIPHIKRALDIKDRLNIAGTRQDTLRTGLDNLSFGVVVLDKSGLMLEASAVAMELLRSESAMGINADGTLWLHEPAGRQLKQWIEKGMPDDVQANGLLHARRAIGRSVSVTVTRLPEQATSWFGGGPPGWMLLLFDPERELTTSIQLVARDLGISEREAEVAALLAAGNSISVVAQRLNISIHTVRTHLKAIFASTDIHSQTELLLRIRGGPGGNSRFR
jgi:DNA-binding CsgD family transcriptional regulator